MRGSFDAASGELAGSWRVPEGWLLCVCWCSSSYGVWLVPASVPTPCPSASPPPTPPACVLQLRQHGGNHGGGRTHEQVVLPGLWDREAGTVLVLAFVRAGVLACRVNTWTSRAIRFVGRGRGPENGGWKTVRPCSVCCCWCRCLPGTGTRLSCCSPRRLSACSLTRRHAEASLKSRGAPPTTSCKLRELQAAWTFPTCRRWRPRWPGPHDGAVSRAGAVPFAGAARRPGFAVPVSFPRAAFCLLLSAIFPARSFSPALSALLLRTATPRSARCTRPARRHSLAPVCFLPPPFRPQRATPCTHCRACNTTVRTCILIRSHRRAQGTCWLAAQRSGIASGDCGARPVARGCAVPNPLATANLSR